MGVIVIMRKRLPDMLLPSVRRRSGNLTAIFEERRGCCKEESAASAQRKDRVGFICRSLPIVGSLSGVFGPFATP
jgi:hypothetical protein